MQILSIIIPAITTILGLAILVKWPPDRRQSFSENIARRPASLITFAVFFVPITMIYYYYLWWLGDQFNVPWLFGLVLMISFVAQLIVAIVPVKGKTGRDPHTIASFVVVGAMLALPVVLSTTSSSVLDLAFLLPVIYVLVNGGLFLLYLLRKKLSFVRSNFLFFQMSFFVVFWLFIILQTYLVLE